LHHYNKGGLVTLSPDGNFTMQWAFVAGGKQVAFKLRLQVLNIP
jgi:hypothetical protein